VTFSTSLQPVVNDLAVTLYPNPVSETMLLYLAPGSPNNVRAVLYDAVGKKVYEAVNIQPAVSYTVDFRGLERGIYFLSLDAEGHRSVQAVVRQ
jgi:hypothetical protein